MKKFLAVVLFCLPAFGQGAYSGRGLYSGAAAYGAGPSCGPPNYSCFVSTTGVVNLVSPIPSWGPNTCNSTSLDTLQACGNLTGAGYCATPSDFGNQICRVTDKNTDTYYLTTDDTASTNAWNIDDTAFIVKRVSTGYRVMTFNPTTIAAAMTSPVLSFPIGAGYTWSHTVNNVFYALGSTPTQLMKNTVVFTPGSASLTPTLLYDYNNSSCLTNSVNGYTGGSFSATWEGTVVSGNNDTVFAMAYSNTGGQETGIYLAVWTVGQTGCDLYNTHTGTVTHNGTLLGSVADQWGGAAYGAIPDLFTLHSANGTPGGDYVTMTTDNVSQGVLEAGLYVWQKGTTSVKLCTIGASGWTANHNYNVLGYRIQPATSNNPGNYIYQIITSGHEGTSGATQPSTWNQTSGGDQSDGTVTWRNIGVISHNYDCSGHTWSGYTGIAPGHNNGYRTYSNPWTAPVNQYTGPYMYADSHFGNQNNNPNDTGWIFNIASAAGSVVNQLGTLPYIGFNEGLFVSPVNVSPGVPNSVGTGGTLGQVRRAFHTYNTGYNWDFDVQNGIALLSQTGKFVLITSDGMGQFGNIDGVHGSCNVGGPDWNSSDSTDYVVGEKVFPMSGNAGDYIYKIQSCSGTCTTGSSAPTWVQSSTVAGVGTFSDGTITWAAAPDVNTPTKTAVQNCRADLMVVKLTR